MQKIGEKLVGKAKLMIRYVVWDWNGTLLDDVDGCVRVLNELLTKRGLGTVTREDYRARFGFPIKPFYEGLGFDVSAENFAALSSEFITAYQAVLADIALHPDALGVIMKLRDLVEGQLVVSAMEHNMLGVMLKQYGVLPFLHTHRGTMDIQAGSKVEVGLATVAALGVKPEHILLVGDTAHDHELAQAIGCQCLLLSLGHQEAPRLAQTGRPVVHELAEVVSFVEAAVGRAGA